MVAMICFIEVAGARVRVIEEGPATGAPVFCVHGVGGWAENWRPALTALASSGFRALAVDLPGFGESERVRMRYFDGEPPGYARFVTGTLDALGVDRAHVVGHSLGGAVAYLAAVCAPARVRSLTLVAAGGLGEDLPLSLRLAALPFAARLLRGRRDAARAGLASCFLDPRRIAPEVWAECDRYAVPALGETVAVLRQGLTLRGVRRALRRRWIATAANYAGPVLVLWGEQDRVLPLRHAAAVPQLFPRAVLRTVSDAGHLVQLEQAPAFNEALLEFLCGPASHNGAQ